jgi:hypothetical protein
MRGQHEQKDHMLNIQLQYTCVMHSKSCVPKWNMPTMSQVRTKVTSTVLHDMSGARYGCRTAARRHATLLISTFAASAPDPPLLNPLLSSLLRAERHIMTVCGSAAQG